jgi:DNA mismatch endonuclease, patch repair protein
MPGTRPEYWTPKLKGNVRRDIEAAERLVLQGWTPLIIWECQTEERESLSRVLAQFLGG